MNYSIHDIVRFMDSNDFLYNQQPEITNYYMLLKDIIKYKKLSHRVINISGIYPIKRLKKINTMNFITINTNRTYYAALKEVESIFGIFYLESHILPRITPISTNFLQNPKKNYPELYRKLIKRGAFLYGIEK